MPCRSNTGVLGIFALRTSAIIMKRGFYGLSPATVRSIPLAEGRCILILGLYNRNIRWMTNTPRAETSVCWLLGESLTCGTTRVVFDTLAGIGDLLTAEIRKR